jgi:hypothetical protein
MKKHRGIFIPSLAVFILLSCFIAKSEGRPLLSLEKTFGEPLCNEWFVDYQLPLVYPLYYNFQNKEATDYTSHNNSSAHLFFNAETSNILERKCVLSKWNQSIGTSQRPPPLFAVNNTFNSNR